MKYSPWRPWIKAWCWIVTRCVILSYSWSYTEVSGRSCGHSHKIHYHISNHATAAKSMSSEDSCVSSHCLHIAFVLQRFRDLCENWRLMYSTRCIEQGQRGRSWHYWTTHSCPLYMLPFRYWRFSSSYLSMFICLLLCLFSLWANAVGIGEMVLTRWWCKCADSNTSVFDNGLLSRWRAFSSSWKAAPKSFLGGRGPFLCCWNCCSTRIFTLCGYGH